MGDISLDVHLKSKQKENFCISCFQHSWKDMTHSRAVLTKNQLHNSTLVRKTVN